MEASNPLTALPPLIAMRFVSLFVFTNCALWCALWIRRNPQDRFYAFPALAIFLHAILFYTFYLMDYFALRGVPFVLQAYSDWGAFFILHVGFTSLFILIDLVTNLFTKFLARHFPALITRYG